MGFESDVILPDAEKALPFLERRPCLMGLRLGGKKNIHSPWLKYDVVKVYSIEYAVVEVLICWNVHLRFAFA
jgi:hypothetical protein